MNGEVVTHSALRPAKLGKSIGGRSIKTERPAPPKKEKEPLFPPGFAQFYRDALERNLTPEAAVQEAIDQVNEVARLAQEPKQES